MISSNNNNNNTGVIFAPSSPRLVSTDEAQAIATEVRRYGERSSPADLRDLQGRDLQRCVEVLAKVTLRKVAIVIIINL
jgi:phosphoribosylanthranilate isomerase